MQWTNKKLYTKNVHQTQEILFEKQGAFGNGNTNEQTLFKNLAIFDFESNCVQEESSIDNNTTKGIGKHITVTSKVPWGLWH